MFQELLSGGSQTVFGRAVSVTVSSGGLQTVSSGGVASNTTATSSGFIFVSIGGTTTSSFIADGGENPAVQRP